MGTTRERRVLAHRPASAATAAVRRGDSWSRHRFADAEGQHHQHRVAHQVASHGDLPEERRGREQQQERPEQIVVAAPPPQDRDRERGHHEQLEIPDVADDLERQRHDEQHGKARHAIPEMGARLVGKPSENSRSLNAVTADHRVTRTLSGGTCSSTTNRSTTAAATARAGTTRRHFAGTGPKRRAQAAAAATADTYAAPTPRQTGGREVRISRSRAG